MNPTRLDVFTKILITLLYCSIASKNGWRRLKYIIVFEPCWVFCIVARDFCRSDKFVISMFSNSLDVRPDLDLKFSKALSKLDLERGGLAAIMRW
jgi:hypothetical protein